MEGLLAHRRLQTGNADPWIKKEEASAGPTLQEMSMCRTGLRAPVHHVALALTLDTRWVGEHLLESAGQVSTAASERTAASSPEHHTCASSWRGSWAQCCHDATPAFTYLQILAPCFVSRLSRFRLSFTSTCPALSQSKVSFPMQRHVTKRQIRQS